MPIGKYSIIDVKLGPKSEDVLNKNALDKMLKFKGYKNARASRSFIKYR